VAGGRPIFTALPAGGLKIAASQTFMAATVAPSANRRNFSRIGATALAAGWRPSYFGLTHDGRFGIILEIRVFGAINQWD
jgi:hypothetical protein